MNAIARRAGCTEGQAYTTTIGFVVAVVLLLIGIPPVLRDHGESTPAAAASSSPSTVVAPGEPVAAPSTTLPVATMTSLVAPARPVPARPAPAPSGPASPATPQPTPRAVVDSGYTSASSGTPLSGPEVPEDGMPVGVRLGRVDKMSFARLSGTAPALRLALVDDPAANQLVALAAVRACVITEPGWSLSGPGAPPDEAPEHDTRRCVDGEATPGGEWDFDLRSLGHIDDAAGVALIPVSEGPTTFQVTFSAVAR